MSILFLNIALYQANSHVFLATNGHFLLYLLISYEIERYSLQVSQADTRAHSPTTVTPTHTPSPPLTPSHPPPPALTYHCHPHSPPLTPTHPLSPPLTPSHPPPPALTYHCHPHPQMFLNKTLARSTFDAKIALEAAVAQRSVDEGRRELEAKRSMVRHVSHEIR